MTAVSWNPNLYDQKHDFVSKLGESLLDLLAPQPNEAILDLGCGTGDLSMKISKSGANVTGIDQSEEMIKQAREKYSELCFEIQDAGKLEYSEQFHAVFSNAALHWIKTPEAVLESVFQALKPGGRFIAEFGGKGNVQLITDELIHQLENSGSAYRPSDFPWYFPSIGEYTSLMESAGFKVVFAHHFDRPTSLAGEDGLKNWLGMFGGGFFEKNSEEEKRKIVQNTILSLRKTLYREGQWITDYKRIRIIGLKE